MLAHYRRLLHFRCAARAPNVNNGAFACFSLSLSLSLKRKKNRQREREKSIFFAPRAVHCANLYQSAFCLYKCRVSRNFGRNPLIPDLGDRNETQRARLTRLDCPAWRCNNFRVKIPQRAADHLVVCQVAAFLRRVKFFFPFFFFFVGAAYYNPFERVQHRTSV